MVKFLRRSSTRYVKLGKGVKKNQKWRRPTGRDNKMREKRKGRPAVVSVGYKKEEVKKITIVKSLNELEKAMELPTSTKQAKASSSKGEIILGNVGKKKKIEIAKKAKEKGIKISNLNIEKFLRQVKKEEDKKKASKKPKTETKKESKTKTESKK